MSPTRDRRFGAAVTGALAEVRVPAYVIDRDGRFRWLNRGAVELIGDAVGQSFARVVAGDQLNLARTEFAKKLMGATSEYELDLIDVDGRRITVRISSAPLRSDGEIIGVFGVACPAEGAGCGDVRSHFMTAPAPELTARQHEVLALLADGLGTGAIARHLGVAEETARNHIRALLRQLGVHSRLEAVVAGYRVGLLTLPPPERPSD